jgi:uncharacterized protein YebE (UPF0316 family)
MVHTVKGKTITAGLIAFIEVFIWFIIAREALNNGVESIWIAISYAGGFATGTLLGTFISNKFINTLISVEVITSKASKENIEKIRLEGFGVSVVNTSSSMNDIDNKILFITLNSKHLDDLKRIIRHIDKNAFMVVNESKVVQNGFIK